MKFIVYAMIATVTSAYAQSHQVIDAKKVGGVTINNRIVTPSVDISAGIITPNQAAGVTRFSKYYSINGNMVVCPISKAWLAPDDTCSEDGRSQWIKIQESIPAEKKFVGFSIAPTGAAIFVYWK